MSNAIYGKTEENLRNKFDVRLVNSAKDFKMDIKTKLCIAQNI